ncbi:MAG TPA: hypothetical protein VHI54_02640 [Actinomycetota bacterium]|nr:hypothetical protein [Actinomycetota bacterium]
MRPLRRMTELDMCARTHDDLASKALQIVEQASAMGLSLRILGGVVIRWYVTVARETYDVLRPVPNDIDLLAPLKSSHAIRKTLTSLGYEPDDRLIAWRGDQRHRYCEASNGGGVYIDVFLGTPPQCHRLELAHALATPGPALPPTLLLLTKLQIASINEKDLIDVGFLLLESPSALTNDGSEASISLGYLADVLRRDWGFHHTALGNLRKLSEKLDSLFPATFRSVVDERINALTRVIQEAPKTLRWKVRSKVGTRWQWYQDVEEVVR